jgi:hypothetical protein
MGGRFGQKVVILESVRAAQPLLSRGDTHKSIHPTCWLDRERPGASTCGRCRGAHSASCPESAKSACCCRIGRGDGLEGPPIAPHAPDAPSPAHVDVGLGETDVEHLVAVRAIARLGLGPGCAGVWTPVGACGWAAASTRGRAHRRSGGLTHTATGSVGAMMAEMEMLWRALAGSGGRCARSSAFLIFLACFHRLQVCHRMPPAKPAVGQYLARSIAQQPPHALACHPP